MAATTWYSLGIDTKGRTTGEVKTICPKCGPTRKHHTMPSLNVNLDKGVWRCHNDGCDFRGALESRDMFDGPKVRIYATPPVVPDARLKPRGIAFLEGRKLDVGVAKEVGIYSNDADTALAFPYIRDGKVVHIKYRSVSEKTFWTSKDTEAIFYGLDVCRDATELIIVEGECDALAFWSAGHDNVLSVPMGAPNEGDSGSGKLTCLESAHELLSNATKVIIAPESDSGGNTLARELIRRIGPEKCWRVEWPEGTKDANEALMNYGEAGLNKLLAAAKPVPLDGLIYFNDVREDVWDNRFGQIRSGVEVNWPHFRELYRVGQSQMTVVTGEPSSGKSIFLTDMLVRVVEQDPSWSFAIFSPEQPPTKFFGDMVRQTIGRAAADADRSRFDTAGDWVNENFIRSSPNPPTLDHILELARVCVLRHGVKGIVIDPWTEVQTSRQAGVNESEHIGNCLMRIRRFGQMHNCHMWIVAHPTKIDDTRKNKEITPYQISGSANWFNKADAILSIYREERTTKASPVQVFVQKQRFEEYGGLGMQRFFFDLNSKKYYEIAMEAPAT